MASYTSGLSTLGVELGYGTYTDNATLPGSLTALGRINAIGGIELSTENIDSSALVDRITQYVAGRSDTGGEWTVTINLTNETQAEWEALQGTTQFFEVYHPSMSKGLWVAATVPSKLGLPEIGQNELLTYEISLTLNFYYGWATAVAIMSEGHTISLSPTTVALTGVGDTETVTATVTPAGTEVTWVSSDTDVATVSSGTITAVAAGTCTVTATAGSASATVAVTVTV